jgi:hypothetical protein
MKRMHLGFCAVGKHHIPQGHFENCPAFKRRGLTVLQTSPAGTTENGGSFQPSLRDSTFFQLIPALKCRAILDGSFGTEHLLNN